MACGAHNGSVWTCTSNIASTNPGGNLYHAACPSNRIAYTDASLVEGVIIKAVHINELRNAINTEQNRRKNISSYANAGVTAPANPCPSNVVTAFGTAVAIGANITKTMVQQLRAALDDTMKKFTWTKPIDSSVITHKGDVIQEIRDNLYTLEQVCMCNCNYCTCNCNYCTCACNYACTCNCNYCPCNCAYCPCDCNYCPCDCNYCPCNCNYCTCNCNYPCTCNCNYPCTCNCNYPCTCNCAYSCTCNCAYSCTCNCNYPCTCNCAYSCTCTCNYHIDANIFYKFFEELR